MGNREKLLEGTKRCLYEKGYSRTTVRDIAAASGVSMAAIGYHFGSKEALVNTALRDMNGSDLGDEFQYALTSVPHGSGSVGHFEQVVAHMLDSFHRHRDLVTASMESLGQIEHVPEVRQVLAQGHRDALSALAAEIQGTDSTVDAASAQAIGSLYYTLVNGLMMQWVVDPAATPDAHELAEALRTLTREDDTPVAE